MIDLAIYLHWPFCARICPYCDFNVTRARGIEAQTALLDAMRTDLKSQAKRLGQRRLVTLYFGGGTPSLMQPEWVAILIDEARGLFDCDPDLEITLEANPATMERARFREFAAAGVNRLSLGVQALDDTALQFLGRDHDARDAMMSIEMARTLFDRVSVDLITGRPGQAIDDWKRDLKTVSEMGVEHISPYQLTIETDTAFGRAAKRGQLIPIADDRAVDFHLMTQSVLEACGYEAYEVSNHARGPKARSRHNLHIWRGGDYLGVGPGAHGRISEPAHRSRLDSAHGRINGQGGVIRVATEGLKDRRDYIAQVKQIGHGMLETAMTPQEAFEEQLLFGLRISEGVEIATKHQDDMHQRALPLVESGHLNWEGHTLSATPSGRLVLDRLIYALLA